jgi:hypothetical protein
MKPSWTLGIATVTLLSASFRLFGFGEAASSESPAQQSAPASTVTIQLFQYKPGDIEVKPGMKVTWVKGHIITLRDVIDGQAARDWPKVYGNLRMAASHMAMIAAPLGSAIAKQFPQRFARQ